MQFPLSKTKNVKVGWKYGQSHMKIGISNTTANPIVCFGDANHRRSEVTHAGMMVKKEFIFSEFRLSES